MKEKKVSVIIPTYNRAHVLKRSIQSVMNQTYKELEIIVVDDGSTDDTKDLINKLQQQDERIKYIRHDKNRGAAAARNTGIKASAGIYIAFNDSDDEWLPTKLEEQVSILENTPPYIGVVYTGLLRIEKDRKIYLPSAKIRKKDNNIHKEIIKNKFIGLPSMLMRKVCFEKVGLFDEQLPALEDWELLIRVSKYFKFKYIPKPLVIAHSLSNRVSTPQTHAKARKLILQKHYREFSQHKKLLIKHLLLYLLLVLLSLLDNKIYYKIAALISQNSK